MALVEVDQVEDGLLGFGVEGDGAGMLAFADELEPLAGLSLLGEHLVDVEVTEFVGAQAGVQGQLDESAVSFAKGFTGADGPAELLLLAGE